MQVTSVVQVNSPFTRAALAEASGGQNYVERAATFLVFYADLQRNQQICQRQQQQMPIGFTEHTLIASIDTALIAQNVLLAALSLGLGGFLLVACAISQT